MAGESPDIYCGGEVREADEEPQSRSKSTGYSPDIFDAVCCGVEGARRLGFAIEWRPKAEQREEKRESSRWKRELIAKASAAWSDGGLDYQA